MAANHSRVVGDARKRLEAEQADTPLAAAPFSLHPQCLFCQRRYEHTHWTAPVSGVVMAEYQGSDPT